MSQPSKWFFSIETALVLDGKKLQALKPDTNGYYDIPCMALGVPTRNGLIYTPEFFIKSISDPNTKFYKTLTDGNLFGCIRHPVLEKREDLSKLLVIDHKEASHHISKIYTGETLSNGGTLVLVKSKPYGPYGNTFEQSVTDPNINTALSIRSICKERYDSASKQTYRDVHICVTFDFVDSQGYREACKRFAPSLENYKINITPENIDIFEEIGCESFSDNKELLNTLGAIKLEFGKYYKGNKSFIDHKGMKRSLSHMLLRGNK